MPLVSVIIPTFNRAHDLERALRSVRAQSFSDWEVVVVDNHSTDGTLDLITRIADSRIRVELIRNNGIIAASRNLGIRKATGDYVAFLDSDDWWTPEKLRISVVALEAGADVAFHDLYLMRSAKQNRSLPARSARRLESPIFRDLILNGNGLANSGVTVRRDLLERMGPLTEEAEFVGIEDFDAWLRLSMITERFTFLPDILGYYWVGGGNMTNAARTIRSTEALARKYSSEISETNGDMNWFHYSRGRAYLSLKRYRVASANFRSVKFSRMQWKIYVKAKFMIFCMKWARGT